MTAFPIPSISDIPPISITVELSEITAKIDRGNAMHVVAARTLADFITMANTLAIRA